MAICKWCLSSFGVNTMSEEIRTFDTGATRDADDGKLDYDGFLSEYALTRYAEYMNYHRTQSDGEVRPSDNWKRGIPREQYMKSAWRHFMDMWRSFKGIEVKDSKTGKPVTTEEAACGLLFNIQGLLHELVKEKNG